MALFDEKILNPEERYGDFSPFESDDQSFQLEKIGQYPGELPDIGLKKDIPVAEVEEEIDIDALFGGSNDSVSEESISDQSSINDNSNFSETDPFTFQEEKIIQNDDAGSLWQDWDNNLSIEEPTTDSKSTENIISEVAAPEIPETKDITQSDPFSTVDDLQRKEEAFIDKDLTEIKVSGSSAILDDDFIAELSKEVAKAKGKRTSSSIDSPAELSELENKEKIKKFESVDNLDEATTFEFSEITAAHPSTSSIAEETVPQKKEPKVPTEPIESKPAKKEKVKKEKPVKEKKEKKERKPIAWKKLIIPAAALLLLSLIGGGIYYSLTTNIVHNIAKSLGFVSDSAQVDSSHIAQKSDKKLEHADPHKNEHDVKKDTTKHEETKVAEVPKEEPKHEEAKHEEAKPVETKHEITKHEIKKPEPKHDAHEKVKTEHKAEKKELKSHESKQKEIRKSDVVKSDITKKKDLAKDKNISKPVEKKATKLKEIKPETQEKGVFMVEVYSTPSIEDAEEWLRKLSKKNINDANISTMKVRDKIWYRVRYGRFETKDAAKLSAQKLGLSQSWIDRIK